MKSFIIAGCMAGLVAASGVAQARSDRFFVEAGGERLWLSKVESIIDANILIGLPPAFRNETHNDARGVWAARAAVGYRITDAFGVKVAYEEAESSWERSTFELIGSNWIELIQLHYEDRMRMLTLAPEYRLQLKHGWEIAVSPQLSRIQVREKSRVTWSQPYVDYWPSFTTTDAKWTFGGSLTISYRVSDPVQVFVDYSYWDLKPARGRTANAVGGGIRLNW